MVRRFNISLLAGIIGYLQVLKKFLTFCRCDEKLLLKTLCTRSIKTREGSIVKELDCDAATSGRDALAKTVYARLFDWYSNSADICITFELVHLCLNF